MKILSISIAAYNIEKYIHNTLDNLCNDEIIDDLDIIIVNDGSNDKTLSIAREYQSKYPESIRIIDKENGGYGSTINASLPVAQGKYYKLLDGDDWYHKSNLVDFIQQLKKAEADLIITPYLQVNEDTKKETLIDSAKAIQEDTIINYSSYPDNARINMHQSCFKVSIIQNKNIRITEHCFYTDVEYLLKCMSYCKSIQRINLPVYMYRTGIEEQSMSFQGMRKHYEDTVKSYKAIIDFRKNNEIKKDYDEKYLKPALVSLGEYYLSIFLYLDPTKKKEYIEFEKYINNNALDIYSNIDSKTIKWLRRSRYSLYRFLCFINTKKAKKKSIMWKYF